MAILKFEDIKFTENKDGIRAHFLRNFYFDISKDEMERLGKWKILDECLEVEGDETPVKRKFNMILEHKLQHLKSLQGRDATFIFNGMLPLVGSLYFGIIDRDTNVIEVRPVTGCNQKCIFCSVNLDLRQRDFVVNLDFLLKEFSKVAEIKLEKLNEDENEDNGIEAHINAQGEPLLYSNLAELIKGLRNVEGVKRVSMDTNGLLLTPKKVDELVKAGLTRFNISIEAMSRETANKVSGISYPLEHIKEICRYIAGKADFLLAPVWLHGINDSEIEKIIVFALELKKIQEKNGRKQNAPFIGIQNFLEYELGKNPVKEQPWPVFYSFLEKLEKKYGLKLKLSREDFGIVRCRSLEKPFRKGDIVYAKIICPGMLDGEIIMASDERMIVVPNSPETKTGKTVKVKITRDKYNVFYAKG